MFVNIVKKVIFMTSNVQNDAFSVSFFFAKISILNNSQN